MKLSLAFLLFLLSVRPALADPLVAAMTLDEKIGQLQNAAPSIPRLGLPAYDWWNEGLHGLARDGEATVFPQAIGLAASWDTDLLRAVGQAVAGEARAKAVQQGAAADRGRYQGLTIWSPNINIFRDPRWGRGQETYGEDPTLTGRLAVAFIQGLQGTDPLHPTAIASVKHFAVHSGPEAGRHGFDVDVSPYDLEATYLPAFRAAVTEGRAGSVMCAYNALHGTPVCADADLLRGRLRRDWGFTGYVVTDCDAVEDMALFHHFRPDPTSAAIQALRAGTDLDCGTSFSGLAAAVRDHRLPEAVIDRAVGRLMDARRRLGLLASAPMTGGAEDPAVHRDLALRAARESLVLLKNRDALLPLSPGSHIAVIGPDADGIAVLEANYHGTARDPVTPLAGLRALFGADHVAYAQGATLAEQVPVLLPETALRSGDAPGLSGAYYDRADMRGDPVLRRTDRVVDFDWDHVAPAAGLDPRHYAVRWSGVLRPPGPGDYRLAVRVDRCFDCRGHDPVRLTVDGTVLIDDTAEGKSPETTLQAVLHVKDETPLPLTLDYVHQGEDQGVHLQWLAPADLQLAEAASAARDADAVVAVVGLSPDIEGEELRIAVPGFDGGDRTELALPAPQKRLLETLAASGKKLVVVVLTGGAVALPWEADHADALLIGWYPGEAGGTALAETLIGRNNPAGRLPVTFYRSTRDLPPFVDYGMAGRTYRYFTGAPLFPFGSGLSYSHFAYRDAALSSSDLKAGESLSVSASVSNIGAVTGDEIVQLYLIPPQGPLAPRRSLVGFQRVHLEPGESRRVVFDLGPRALSSVDAAGRRGVEAGSYKLFVGGGQPGDADGVESAFTVQGQASVAP